MKNISRIIALMLVAVMILALASCGNSETNKENVGSEGSKSVSTNNSSENDDNAEMNTIEVAFLSMSPLDDSNTAAVIDAINKITEEKINVHVNIKWYAPNTYLTQVPMMIQANEKLDLIHYTPVEGAGYSSFQTSNQLLEIGDLLNEYAPETVSLLGDLLDATSTSEGVYATTCYRLLSTDEYIIMRKDILDELGLTDKAENMSTWNEFEEILAEVKANYDISPIANVDAQGTIINPHPAFNGSDNFSENYFYDNLGDNYNLISCDKDDKISCYFFTEQYKAMIDRVAKWYQKGYVYKDAATSQDVDTTLMKNGVTFSSVALGEVGIAETRKASTGYEVVAKKIIDGVINTGSCVKFGFAVPVTATEPEAAVKFLNLLYTDLDINNILAWGVEGRDWVENDEGLATYPDGVTAETVQYHTSDFLYGNQFNVISWDSSIEKEREVQKEAMDNARKSKYLGFTVDSTNVENEAIACFNVTKEYKASLSSGSVDVETVYAEYCQKLEAAGIQKIIDEYQSQLDKWLAEKE